MSVHYGTFHLCVRACAGFFFFFLFPFSRFTPSVWRRSPPRCSSHLRSLAWHAPPKIVFWKWAKRLTAVLQDGVLPLTREGGSQRPCLVVRRSRPRILLGFLLLSSALSWSRDWNCLFPPTLSKIPMKFQRPMAWAAGQCRPCPNPVLSAESAVEKAPQPARGILPSVHPMHSYF